MLGFALVGCGRIAKKHAGNLGENKIEGAKLAGVKTILYPKQNEQDIDIIKNKNKSILENIEIRPVQTIWDILEVCLEDNDIEFNNYI